MPISKETAVYAYKKILLYDIHFVPKASAGLLRKNPMLALQDHRISDFELYFEFSFTIVAKGVSLYFMFYRS